MNKDLHKFGKSTQFPHNDPTKGGRPKSFTKQLNELLDTDGQITIPRKQVIEIQEDGSVIVKTPTRQQLSLKLLTWAMSNKGNDSLKATQMILERTDGKPVQPIEDVTPKTDNYDFTKLNDKELETLKKILSKALIVE